MSVPLQFSQSGICFDTQQMQIIHSHTRKKDHELSTKTGSETVRWVKKIARPKFDA